MRIQIRIGVAAGTLLFASLMLFTLAQNAPTVNTTDTATAANFTIGSPAPAGFDNKTNGFVSQAMFDADRDVFEEREGNDDGIGPTYNATSCVDCHGNPVTGAGSQITEMRAGHWDGRQFIDHPGGSLIQDRATNANIQETIMPGYEVRAPRLSLNVLGDGFVEAIDDNTLIGIANRQPFGMRGQVIKVPVFEANGALRVGRFGWKNQHASLVSFSADAYLNEMGITSPLLRTENTSNGNSIQKFDAVADPEDDGEDVAIFARFMRATKVPPRDEALAATADAQNGSSVFTRIGCETCHVRTILTAATGTVINGGAFVVPPQLGNKIIHPFSDFLLHDIGTGDGIVQNGGVSTRNKVRTGPLWGLRTKTRLMHDGESLTINDAVMRHQNEANGVINQLRSLSAGDRRDLLTFLNSL
jgi:CxxC motif-containing protein (DUF1111 family)